MENAVEALKMAFAVIVLVIALSVSIMTFSQARQTADIVLKSADETAYYEYDYTGENLDKSGNRIVGVETIMPTLYRYKTDYIKVVIKDENNIEQYSIDSNNLIDESKCEDIYDFCKNEKFIEYISKDKTEKLGNKTTTKTIITYIKKST